jgi:hypothetical protein
MSGLILRYPKGAAGVGGKSLLMKLVLVVLRRDLFLGEFFLSLASEEVMFLFGISCYCYTLPA